MRMLAPDGTPVERHYFCEKEDRELDDEEIVRGYEVEKGEFVLVTDEELEAIEPRKSRDIDLREFVPVTDVDPRFFRRAYFLVPAGESTTAYRLLADAMERTARAGIATFVMRGKEYLVAIMAEDGILRAETLRFADEIRSPAAVGLPDPVKVAKKKIDAIDSEIRKHSKKIDYEELLDHHAEEIQQLAVRKQQKNEDVVRTSDLTLESEEGGEVVDLMEVLRRSLGKSDAKAPARRAARASNTGGPPLEKQSREELYREAQRLDIPGRSRMNKTELAEAIRRSA